MKLMFEFWMMKALAELAVAVVVIAVLVGGFAVAYLKGWIKP